MAENLPSRESYHTLQPYLIHQDCAAALEYYKAAFGATERMRMAQPDGRIAHAEIQLGDSCVMMADEHPAVGAYSPAHYGGSPVSLQFYVEDCDLAFRQALSAGGKAEREPADQPYGERVAGVIDPSGYKWWMSSPLKAAAVDDAATAAASK